MVLIIIGILIGLLIGFNNSHNKNSSKSGGVVHLRTPNYIPNFKPPKQPKVGD